MENVFFIGRLILGIYFIYCAYNHFANLEALAGYAKSKSVPNPKAAVFLTGLMLFVGGATIISGMSMIAGLWILIIFLLATSFMMHQYWKITDPMAQMADKINFQKNIALVGALLVIVALLY